MDGGQDNTDEIVRAIARFIAANPYAMDSIDGIRSHWLAPGRYQASDAVLTEALERLLQRGVLQKLTLPDGGTIYGAGADRLGRGR